jgi:hypothetical protein
MHTQNAAAAAATHAKCRRRRRHTPTCAVINHRHDSSASGGGGGHCTAYSKFFEPRIIAKNVRQKEEFWQKKKELRARWQRSLKLVATL